MDRLQRLHGSFKSNEGSSEGQKEDQPRGENGIGWRFIDKKKETCQLPALPKSLERATVVFRGDGVTRYRIFECILTSALLNDRLASISPETWQYQSGKF